MSVEALPPSPPIHPRVEDSGEHSFPTTLRHAIDTLFTYQPIAEGLQAAPEDEETAQFIALWKQGIATYLEETATTALSTCLDVFARRKVGEEPAPGNASSGIDPYVIAVAAHATLIDQLQKSGELRKPSEISDPYAAEDHFDDLRQLYKETCLGMGLAWPIPPRDREDTSEE